MSTDWRLWLPAFFLLWASGCSNTENDAQTEHLSGLPLPLNEMMAKGPVGYGGIFHYNEEAFITHLFPHCIRDVQSNRIATNIYEGLVSLSPDSLHIVPAIARSWDISENGTLYVFHLRDDVYFHDDECFTNGRGRKVSAFDFSYSFNLLCASYPGNYGFRIFDGIVAGAAEYFAQTMHGNAADSRVEGIVAIDSLTLSIRLIFAYPDFLQLLATTYAAVVPHEAVELYTPMGMQKRAVGTGPYILHEIKEGERLTLRRNPSYRETDEWGNTLPYLDGIRVSFLREQKAAMLAFEKNQLDMVYRIPLELFDEVLDENGVPRDRYRKYTIQSTPAFSAEYYGFQLQLQPFDNLLFRQALNYAVDRDELAYNVLKGMAIPAHHGIVPRAVYDATGNTADSFPGFDFDPEKAKSLLAESGVGDQWANNKLSLQINSGGGKNIPVAEQIVQRFEEILGLKVNIDIQPFHLHYDKIERGQAPFFRIGWSADIISPESFLRSFYSGTSINEHTRVEYNHARYHNEQFDKMFNLARKTADRTKSNRYFAQAEQLLMEDAAFIPLFTNIEFRLLQPHVRNFPQNSMEFRSFKNVFFDQLNASM